MKIDPDNRADLSAQIAEAIREEIGPDNVLMMDANQKWDVNEAIENMTALAEYKPMWIEEPTNCDDIVGHRAIAEAGTPVLAIAAKGPHTSHAETKDGQRNPTTRYLLLQRVPRSESSSFLPYTLTNSGWSSVRRR